jgi:murein DD-endopeptidase MepM/ murein hydrolase activator NlpD
MTRRYSVNKVNSYIPVIISLFISLVITLFIGLKSNNDTSVKEVYNVYLDGKLLGSINSKIALENYIDKEQKELKEEYNVDKVYVPTGIDIERCVTKNAKILTEKQIYNKIKSKKNFTIKGYVVTITDDDGNEQKVNILKKNLFDKAAKKVLKVFVDSKDVKNYKNDTQKEIETTGSLIENIYIGQTVTIKESFISTDELIFDDVTTLTKYLLFGSLDKDEEYTVQPGDTIETVAFNNKLGVEEFLIVNPEFTSANNLLSVGQKVSIALIDPMLDIIVEKHIVEDMDKPYETVEKEDSSLYSGTTKTETEGVNGTQRVTEKIKYKNGETMQVVITNTEVIKEPVNKVVLKGTKTTSSSYSSTYSGGGTYVATSGEWGWPTVSPYIITSTYKYRWGRLHAGIDISAGFGSPLYAAKAGTVLSTVTSCSPSGYYGSSCGSGYGNSVTVDVGNGMQTIYAHMGTVSVKTGQTLSKGQYIGTMGNSGSSTGTHLHFGVYYGSPLRGGTAINPLSLY